MLFICYACNVSLSSICLKVNKRIEIKIDFLQALLTELQVCFQVTKVDAILVP